MRLTVEFGALSQRQDGSERVIAYFSRIFGKAERNYCVTCRELLAIVDSVKTFHCYLYGRKFLIRTDHVSLKWLMSFKNLERQLARWLERLQQYEFEVLHRREQAHKNADGLSRRHCEAEGCTYCAKVKLRNILDEGKQVARIVLEGKSLEDWRREQKEDPSIAFIFESKEIGVRPPRK